MTMELASGNIAIRLPEVRMSKGTVVVGHTHNFDHTTFCTSGALQIELLPHLSGAESDEGVQAEQVTVIRAGDMRPWALIKAGRRHRITSLEDGSVYLCIYAHQYPQALNLSTPGDIDQPPKFKREDDGTLWVRVDETIVQEHTGWAPAYI